MSVWFYVLLVVVGNDCRCLFVTVNESPVITGWLLTDIVRPCRRLYVLSVFLFVGLRLTRFSFIGVNRAVFGMIPLHENDSLLADSLVGDSVAVFVWLRFGGADAGGRG